VCHLLSRPGQARSHTPRRETLQIADSGRLEEHTDRVDGCVQIVWF